MLRKARNEASEERRTAILDAALACFAEHGVQGTTMAMVCKRAGASTGSVYHHFQSKEQLAAALYLDGISRAQRHALEALVRPKSAERGISALVTSYLEWVEQHPELSRFLLAERHAEFMQAAEASLSEMNGEFRRVVNEWLVRHVREGTLPRLAPDLYRSLLIGPIEHFARQWLSGQATTSMAEAQKKLGAAVFQALSSLAKH